MKRICWFPDNTVLCNFAVVDRVALLKAVLDDRGRWTTAVAFEAGRSANYVPQLRPSGCCTRWCDSDARCTTFPRTRTNCVPDGLVFAVKVPPVAVDPAASRQPPPAR